MTYNSDLFSFAFFPKYNNAIHFLAEDLAAPEEWDYSDTQTKTYSILKNYLEFTFKKLKQEGKVAYTPDNKFACFNTGLVTNNLEDIFAFLKSIGIQRQELQHPFVLRRF